MKKIFLIGWKDVTLAFRDKAALIFMLAAPLALTFGLGLVSGRFSGGSSSGVSNIPVVIVNQDGGQLGEALVQLFQSEDLATLVEPTLMDDPAAARAAIDMDQAAAAVIVPAGFTDSVIPPQGETEAVDPVQIQLYTNPTRPTSSGVVKTILEEFLSQVEVGRVGGQVAVTQLVASGRIQVQEAVALGQQVGQNQADLAGSSTAITLNNVTSTGEEVKFDILAVLAPGMALMFLMFTASNGGRTLLLERNQGTLPRLMVSPTAAPQVLAGKTFGTYLTGVVQMLLLILASTIFFQVQWGDPLGILVLVLAAVAGAVGWGMFITAVARTPGQVSAIGSAIMLTFGILGGTFISMDAMPSWFRLLTKISPNAWGIDGFTTLALGGGLKDILTPVLALLVMGAVLFAVAALLLNRRGLARN
jgi:ABC-2 type transport system permease protein